MIEIIKYTPEFKPTWNDFVESSKNGTFLFNRDYMDYHADRFKDNSFLIFRKGKLYCLLPANINDSTLFSHQGLTYGGLIMSEKCSAEGVLEVFNFLLELLKESGISKFIYKSIPHIYHKLPSEEDLYALFRNNASLISRNISSTIPLPSPLRLKKDRREAVRRAINNNISVAESSYFETFWEILEENLKFTYGAKPVHSLKEMRNLVASFPQNIKLIAAYNGEKIVAGLVAYFSGTTIHAQYISANPEGKKTGAVDLIIHTLIEKYQNSLFEWLDLGTSNEDGGKYLNESLIYQKEGFGGRGICYDTYEIKL